MSHVVTRRCVDCSYTDCCAVCPVDCFYEIQEPYNMLVIDPDTCIDCDLCQEACPVNAIWPDDELPSEYAEWKDLNEQLFSTGTNIIELKRPLPEAKDLSPIQEEELEKGWNIAEPSSA